MALYQFVFLDHETGIIDAAEIQCDTDEQVIAEARNCADGGTVVIQHNDRWVGTVEGARS